MTPWWKNEQSQSPVQKRALDRTLSFLAGKKTKELTWGINQEKSIVNISRGKSASEVTVSCLLRPERNLKGRRVIMPRQSSSRNEKLWGHLVVEL